MCLIDKVQLNKIHHINLKSLHILWNLKYIKRECYVPDSLPLCERNGGMSGIANIPSPFTVDISRDVSVLSSGGGGGGTYFSGVVAQLPDEGI